MWLIHMAWDEALLEPILILEKNLLMAIVGIRSVIKNRRIEHMFCM